MSHIPNNAMPHAGPQTEETGQSRDQESAGSASAFTQIADKAREYPKTAIAAGAAVAAGVVAAAAVGIRSRSGKSGNDKD